jgi:hypothetical protein
MCLSQKLQLTFTSFLLPLGPRASSPVRGVAVDVPLPRSSPVDLPFSLTRPAPRRSDLGVSDDVSTPSRLFWALLCVPAEGLGAWRRFRRPPPRFLDRLLVFRYGIMPRCFFNQITFAYSTYQINRSSTFDVQQHRSCSNGLINPLINPLRGDQMVVDQGWESVGPGTLNTDERNG